MRLSSESRKQTLLAVEKHQKGIFEIVAVESESANVANIEHCQAILRVQIRSMSQNLW